MEMPRPPKETLKKGKDGRMTQNEDKNSVKSETESSSRHTASLTMPSEGLGQAPKISIGSSKNVKSLSVSSFVGKSIVGETSPRGVEGSGKTGMSTSGKFGEDMRSSVTELKEEALRLAGEVAAHRPSAKYAWNDEHTKIFRQGGHLEESWLPEFLDLILVAGLIKLGDGLHYCGLHPQEITFVSFEFLIIFSTRYMIDEFMWHFYLDDLWNQMLFFTFILGVFLMTKMVSYSLDEHTYECSLSEFHMSLYMVGLLITRVVLTVFWIVELYFDVNARDLYYMYPVRNIISILLCILSMALPSIYDDFDLNNTYIIMGAVVLVEYYFHFFKAFHKKPLLDLNEYWPLSRLNIASPDHTVEQLFECDEELEAVQNRLGVFILIVLGESMIQLLIPSFDLGHKDQMVFLTIMGLLLVWSVAKQFFDAAQRVPNGHALRRDMMSGNQWILMHGISGWFTFVLGIGLKFLYADLRYEQDAMGEHAIFMAVGCSGTVGCFTFMRFLHKGWGHWPGNKNRLLGYLVRFGIAMVHLSVAWWDIELPEHIVLTHTLIAVVLNSLDLYNFKVDHHLDEEYDSTSSKYDQTATDAPSPDIDLSTGGNNLGFFQKLSMGLNGSGDNLKSKHSDHGGASIPSSPMRGEGRKDKDGEESKVRVSSSNLTGSTSNLSSLVNMQQRPASSSNLFGSSSNLMGSSSNIFDLLQHRKERAAKGPNQVKPRRHGSAPHGHGDRSPSSSRAASNANSRANSTTNFYEVVKGSGGGDDSDNGKGDVDYNKIRDLFATPPGAGRVVVEDDSNDTGVIRIGSVDKGQRSSERQGR